jgi:2-dehydropantoate 2-reductase
MKILIYGAGVLGSLLAYKLKEAGYDVSLLARGQRLADLRQHGLVLEDMLTGQRTTTSINVVEGLAPDEAYDLVLVVMGKHQVGPLLPALAANHLTPNVLFMGNNAAGPAEMVAALGVERVLLGFPQASGTIREHVVYYVANIGRIRGGVVIGELDGAVTPRLEQIAAAFESAGFDVDLCPNIDAWLKTHAAAILPLGAAYYSTGMDTVRLAHTRDAIVLAVRAIREGLQVLRLNAIPVLPPRQKIFSWLPEPLLVALFSRLIRQKIFQYAFAHGSHARLEMQHLAADLQALARKSAVPTPNLDRICALVDPAALEIPQGSAQIPMDWRGVWTGLIVLAGIVLGLAWLRKRSKMQ